MKPKEQARSEWGQYLFEKRTQFPPIQGKHKMTKYISQGDFVGYINTRLDRSISLNTYIGWESKGRTATRENERLVRGVLDGEVY